MEAVMDLYKMNPTPNKSGLEWLKKSIGYGTNITDYQGKKSLRKPRVTACEVVTETLAKKFKRLLAEWQEESIVMSSITEMVMLPSYQAIIGMGPDAVRLILNELKHDPDYLFWALEAITGANPVLPEDEGNLNRMTNAWIKWGQESGII